MATTTKLLREDKAQMIKSALPVKNTILTGKSGRKYKILEVLGAGGFGITYKAVAEVKLENGMTASMFFAIKEHFMKGCYRDADRVRVICPPTMQNDVEQSRDDFRTEAERLMKLNGQSPNIVKVNEWFDANGTRYYVMEYLDGQTLEQYAANYPLPEAKALSLLLPVARAVELVHKEKLLHLDIKPDNIVLKTDIASGATIPVLIDFGLAKHFDKNGKPTSHLVAKGATEGYAPIEQYAEIARFAPEIDVYALGATLFFLLTGKNPPRSFDIQTVTTLMERLPADVSPRVKQALMGAMQRNNFDRTQTVAEFVVALEGAGYDALPVGYVLRGKNNESYVITEVVGYTDGYITYKARLGSSYTAGSGGTLPFKEYYLFESFYKDWDVRLPDGSLKPIGLREKGTGLWFPNCIAPWEQNPKLKPTDMFRANNTDYYVCPVKRKAPSFSRFRKKYIVIGVACVLVLIGGVWLYNTDIVSNHEPEIVQPSEDITIFMDSINEPRPIEDMANFVPEKKIEVETKDNIRQTSENARPATEQKKEESLTDEELFDRARTFSDYKALVENGYAPAQRVLGHYYYNGDEGVSKNYKTAVHWYTKAAEQGDACGQNNLGACYESGEGVSQDYEKAVYWYTKSAEQGYALAQCNLGVCYKNGRGVSQDYAKAVYWFTKGAEQGNVGSQNNLGVCYKNGQGVSQDYSKAVYWFTKAAEQGYVLAQYNLGYCYGRGQGVSQDHSKAVYWYTKSAEQGDKDAQENLGRYYEVGLGVSQDYEKAMYWYTKSAEQGDKDAQEALERLKSKR